MNPFIKDPVAQPLGIQSRQCWNKSIKRRRISAISRHAGVAMIAAGIAAAAPAQAIDVNTASASQLESLRGIGPRTAKMIVNERSRAGAFESMEDLSDRVRGLGERRVRALQQAGLDVRSSKAGTALKSEVSIPKEETPRRAHTSKRKSTALIAKPEIISPEPF